MRYPGHCAFWRVVAALGLLDDGTVDVDGVQVDRRRFLARALEPRLQYADDERDVAILRVEVEGVRDGTARRVVHQVIDRRDLATGLTAMSRTVGYAASIGAQMIGAGSHHDTWPAVAGDRRAVRARSSTPSPRAASTRRRPTPWSNGRH